MEKPIKVRVCSFGDDRPLMLRWTDPETGRRKAISSGITDHSRKGQKEAERKAGDLEKELREGKYRTSTQIKWQDFTWRYQDEVLSGLAQKTQNQLNTIFNQVERLCSPGKPSDLTTDRLSRFATKLRGEGLEAITIKNYLAHLKAALRWAYKMKMILNLPDFPEIARAPKANGAMKGRPITGEEFDRMLANVPKALTTKATKKNPHPKRPPAEVIESWRFLLRGLWWSGLRLGEAVNLRWDGNGVGLFVTMTSRRPMLRIDAAAEKGHRDRLLPMAPEFAQLLETVPQADRHGRVFKLLPTQRAERGNVQAVDYVSRVLSAVGVKAGVKVSSKWKRDPETGEKKEVVKFASAHDLRRSFGERWADRVMPNKLMELMRHESIDTTMKFYIGRNAQATADALWDAYEKATSNKEKPVGSANGNNAQFESEKPSENQEMAKAVNPYKSTAF